MISIQKSTPQTYYERSRDFQFIGRLYEVVLNSVKTNADVISYGIPYSDFSPDSFLELLSKTLGFKPKHNYTHNQLLAVCNVFSEILRNKGNMQAVRLLGEAILKTEGVLGDIYCLMQYDLGTKKNLPVLRIIIPDELADIALFYDLLEYIVPAGTTCEVIRGEISDPILAVTELEVTADVTVLKLVSGNESGKLAYTLKGPITPNPIATNKLPTSNHINAGVVWRRGNLTKYRTK
jgi:hypothetical protein